MLKFHQNSEQELLNYLNHHLDAEYIISSVRSSKFKQKILDNTTNHGHWVRTSEHFNNIKNGYGSNFSALGVDRWVCLIGAEALFPRLDLCVIDSGTAITIDVLDKQGFHKGGLIVPGLWSLFESLQLNTANIKTHQLNLEPAIGACILGKSTMEGVSKGCNYMVEGYIDKIVSEINLEYNNMTFIVTGGGELELKNIDHCKHPDLIFKGLEVITQQYTSEKV
jgi:type III pantothenate kinase